MTQSGKRLVLFDIDGTLLNGGPLWRECIEASYGACFPGHSVPHIPFCGKTDRQICREMLPLDVAPELIEQKIDDLISGYLARVNTAITGGRSSEVEILPGVRELLEELSGIGAVRLGLLTGNVRKGAVLKLSAVGLDPFFATIFGAFGDDHSDRYRLPSIAVARALDEHGELYAGKQVVIIGDTVHDVNCGKEIGVRSIAVGTGRPEHRPGILEANPDFFFETLQTTTAVLRAITQDL